MRKKTSKMLIVASFPFFCSVFIACPSSPEVEDDFIQDENNQGSHQGGNNQSSKSINGIVNGHEYVDLGLPSGTKWATCNVGASKPEEYGGYYSWGETETKENYGRTYKYGNPYLKMTFIGSDISGTNYDVAFVKWKKPWRMPTYDQFRELSDNAIREWTSINGVYGMKFTGKNGGQIFLPATGYKSGLGLEDAITKGYYWSSTLFESNINTNYSEARNIYVFKDDQDFGIGLTRRDRSYGHSVRPVAMISSDDDNYSDSGIGEAPYFRDFSWTYTNTSVTVQYLTSENNTIKATVYYGTTASPSKSVSTTISGGHIISAKITGLTKATKYYVKCVATNEYGTTTSDVMQVMTGSN